MNYRLFLLLIFFYFQLFANKLIVSQDASSNNNQYKTITSAMKDAGISDTILVKKGIYKEQVIIPVSGKPTAPFLLIGEDSAIVDGEGIGMGDFFNGVIEARKQNDIEIRNMHVVNGERGGILVSFGNRIRVTNCKTYNTLSSGIGIWWSTNVTVDSNDVDLAVNSNSDTLGQECITVAGCDTFEIFKNHVQRGGEGGIYKRGGEGIDAKHGRNGKIYNNRVHNTSRLGIYVDSWNEHMYNVEVFNNTVYNCPSGIAVAAESGGLCENIRIFNNLCYNNIWGGILVESDKYWGDTTVVHPIKNIMIYNNTIVNNSEGIRGSITENVDSIFIYNNIIASNYDWQINFDRTDDENCYVEIGNNCIYGNTKYIGEGAILEDPLLISPWSGNLKPDSKSPVIDEASDKFYPKYDKEYNKRPFGKYPDIGAYEIINNGIPIKELNEYFKKESYYVNVYNKVLQYKFPANVKQVEVISLNGRVMKRIKIEKIDSFIDLSEINNGLYLLRLDKKMVFQIIIQ